MRKNIQEIEQQKNYHINNSNILQQIDDLRQSQHNLQIKVHTLQINFNKQQIYYQQNIQKLENQLNKLQYIQSKIKEDYQLEITKIIGKHNSQIQQVKSNLGTQYNQLLNIHQSTLKQFKIATERNEQVWNSQLSSCQYQRDVIQQNYMRLQEIYEEHEKNWILQKETLQKRIKEFIEEIQCLKDQRLQERKKQQEKVVDLKLQNESLRKKVEELKMVIKNLQSNQKNTQKNLRKSQSNSRNLLTQLNIHKKFIDHKQQDIIKNDQYHKSREKYLFQNLVHMKNKYEKEYSKNIQKPLLSKNNSGSMVSLQSSASLSTFLSMKNSIMNLEQPSKTTRQSSVNVQNQRKLQMKDLQLNPDNSLSPNFKTNKKRKNTSDLRIQSERETMKPPIDKFNNTTDIYTPCFQEERKQFNAGTKKIFIKLKR